MEAQIITIGNSKGLRIPKVLLQQCNISKRVQLAVDGHQLIIKPLNDKPRAGWLKKFKEMSSNKDDQLLISDAISLDSEDWEW